MFRARRSVLYMPGANERALEKAKSLEADSLILDLEDSVAPDAKAEARAKVAAYHLGPLSRSGRRPERASASMSSIPMR